MAEQTNSGGPEETKPEETRPEDSKSVDSLNWWERCCAWWDSHTPLGKVLLVEWYSLAALIGLILFENLFRKLWGMAAIRGILILVIVLGLFRLVHLILRDVIVPGLTPGARPEPEGAEGSESSAGKTQNGNVKWPDPITQKVAWIVLSLAAACFAGLLLSVQPPWPQSMADKLTFLSAGEYGVQINEALVMMFAAGLGSSIATMRAFFGRACTGNFSPSFVPWYPGRIVMGMILGLVFYFVVRGGLLFTIGSANAGAVDELNIWGLAAIGAMVGMFSKEAIEKLREIFDTVFSTAKKEAKNKPKPNLITVLAGQGDKVEALFGPAARTALDSGNAEALETAISGLPPADKTKALGKLGEFPMEAQSFLKPLLEPAAKGSEPDG